MNKFFVPGLLLMAGLYWYLSQPEKLKDEVVATVERIESTLPTQPPRGTESSSWVIHSTTTREGTTAAGQIFSPNPQTPILFKVSFLMAQHNHNGLEPEANFQLILSEWLMDRPAPMEIWASEPRLLPSISQSSLSSWQDFDIPHIRLDPSKEYIAWVTLSELGNPAGTRIAIHNMGPSYSSPPGAGAKPRFDYAEGRGAFFREANPNGRREHMTGFAWQTQNRGHNLHFRMSFENRE
ncbi:MAG: hypothetical protein NDI93_04685 [Pseudomonas sp.]|nr:hypothetical protein [Pseudomonas sp.]